MSFLAPLFLYASLGVAAIVTALHFLVTRQPRAAMLPTARFVPNLPATATSRAARPSDLVLLLLRLFVLLAAGAALAGPVVTPSRTQVARVILADRSIGVADSEHLRDSVKSVYRQGDYLIVFDSGTKTLNGSPGDSMIALATSTARGNLSAALVAAIRAGSELRERADSIELVIVSPFADSEWDAATDTIRKLWPGRARLVKVGMALDTTATRRFAISTRAAADDPIVATMSVARVESATETRLIRDETTAPDIEWAAATGRALIAWPIAARPPGAVAIVKSDTAARSGSAGGVASGNVVVIASFNRNWRYPSDSLAGATVIARWIDGDAAAIERPAGGGCLRSVAIPVTRVGDLAIRPEFIGFARELTGPCKANIRSVALGDSRLATLAGTGRLAPRNGFRAPSDTEAPLAPWLLAAALVAAVLEIFVRRRDHDERRELDYRQELPPAQS